MHDLIIRLVWKCGIDATLARQAVGTVLGHMERATFDYVDGDRYVPHAQWYNTATATMIRNMPGARALVDQFNADNPSHYDDAFATWGGLARELNILDGNAPMAIRDGLMAIGFDAVKVHKIVEEILLHARKHAGDDTVNAATMEMLPDEWGDPFFGHVL